ncbi:MAG: M1 family metallopeptidase [Flammeovirgaceae bacterium]
MRQTGLFILGMLFLTVTCYGQRKHSTKFEQLKSEWRTANTYRTASGAPGHEYWQQQADYDIQVELNDKDQSITGSETITYHNLSPDNLSYLWVQLDQNVRAQGSDKQLTATSRIRETMPEFFMNPILGNDFDGGYKIKSVTTVDGKPLAYTINKTMMMIDLPEVLKPENKFSFKISWSYNINDRMKIGGRSGYEYFAEDDNYLYTIAQFFPRMCVYNDYDGWQNKQFLGGGEFTLPFGNYKVSITVPSDHVVGATGKLQNPDEVLTEKQRELLKNAETAKEPVIIITQDEAVEKEKTRASDTKTWVFHADNVRDFAFASSRKFIWDAMGVEVGGKTIMAMSYYPKEGNPLWEELSTKVVAHTLKVYSKHTIDYPYHKAISVHAKSIGMEYPMICFNFGRPNADGTYDDRTKYRMMMVIIHEVGHNFFPMIVNSDERQWTWMDEGLNTFVQYLAEKAWAEQTGEDYPYRSGPPELITNYMKLDKERLSPIMTNSEQVQNLGPNAYSKPATALNILRETVMGPELFDRAFKEYATRWAFKHPTPEDFFRTMEDASAVDLDWFWRGWFYTVDHSDVAINQVTWYKVGEKKRPPLMNTKADGKKKKKKKKKKKGAAQIEEADAKAWKEFYTKLSDEKRQKMAEGLNFYEVEIANVGGLVMPVIVELVFEDGSKEVHKFPAEIWRKNDEVFKKVFTSTKKVKQIVVDPNAETADTDLSNNVWPAPASSESKFESFKNGKK